MDKSIVMLVSTWLVLVVASSLVVAHLTDAINPGLISDSTIIKNNRPIIGILAQEATGKISEVGKGQIILASYVKMIESAGARAAPIFVDSTPEEVEKMFYSINGAVFPGGHVKLNISRYGTVGKQILDLAIKSNRQGKVFPIWAECLGLELIALLMAGKTLEKGQYDTSFFTLTDARNVNLPLHFTPAFNTSRLFATAARRLINYAQIHPMAYNNHDKGISPQMYNQTPKLKEAFRIISTNRDRQNNAFISTLEGRDFPFFLFHWHPAKSQFEWSKLKNIWHSQEAVWIGQHLADVFINQARLSDHRFPSPRHEKNALIYNYMPTYTEDVATFMQVYFFQFNSAKISN